MGLIFDCLKEMFTPGETVEDNVNNTEEHYRRLIENQKMYSMTEEEYQQWKDEEEEKIKEEAEDLGCDYYWSEYDGWVLDD